MGHPSFSSIPPASAPETGAGHRPLARRLSGGWIFAAVTLSVLVFAVAAGPVSAEDRPRVVATFSILADVAEAVAGDRARVTMLAPVGSEVHEYELRPRDFIALEGADLVLANGYGLEQWMSQVRATVGDRAPIVLMGEESDVEVMPIVTGEFEGDPDPHLWMDPAVVAQYADLIAAHLSKLDPERADEYAAAAETYKDQLKDLDREVRERLETVPERHRVLITSEAAFLYLARAYGYFHDGIWGTNAETEGSARQIMRILDVIAEREPRAVFWESTISSRYVESVAGDAGVEVAGPLYVDSLGDPGSGAETYLEMMRTNARVIQAALADG